MKQNSRQLVSYAMIAIVLFTGKLQSSQRAMFLRADTIFTALDTILINPLGPSAFPDQSAAYFHYSDYQNKSRDSILTSNIISISAALLDTTLNDQGMKTAEEVLEEEAVLQKARALLPKSAPSGWTDYKDPMRNRNYKQEALEDPRTFINPPGKNISITDELHERKTYDVLHLSDGDKLIGYIIEETDRETVFEFADGRRTKVPNELIIRYAEQSKYLHSVQGIRSYYFVVGPGIQALFFDDLSKGRASVHYGVFTMHRRVPYKRFGVLFTPVSDGKSATIHLPWLISQRSWEKWTTEIGLGLGLWGSLGRDFKINSKMVFQPKVIVTIPVYIGLSARLAFRIGK